MKNENLTNCIQECNDCAIECQRCASECLKEAEVKMLTDCINLNLQCTAICELTARFMIMGSQFSEKLCLLCAEVCDACATECEKHASLMKHCADCAFACRDCVASCRAIQKL